jgi:general L-amino acid transport system substrate-binding protein
LDGDLSCQRLGLPLAGSFAGSVFQTPAVPVIFLDLTGIIAFDALREWEAGASAAMRVPEMGGNGRCVHAGKKSGLA